MCPVQCHALVSRMSDGASLACRQGLGDPELRTPGPGLPYPDPEFTAPAMEAVNGTLAQQTGYCEGASPLHAIPIGLCSCAATQCHLFSDVLYLNLSSNSLPPVEQCASSSVCARQCQAGRDHHRLEHSYVRLYVTLQLPVSDLLFRCTCSNSDATGTNCGAPCSFTGDEVLHR